MNETIKVIIPVVISCLGTFIVTKRVTVGTHVREVSKIQLTKIFKPLILYLTYQSEIKTDISEQGFDKLLRKIIIEYYEYVPNELIEYEKRLRKSVEDNNCLEHFQISTEINTYIYDRFEILKQQLNLPSSNLSNRWKLMNHLEKLNWIMNNLVVPLFLFSLIFSIIVGVLNLLYSDNVIQYVFTAPYAFITIFFSSLLITICIYTSDK